MSKPIRERIESALVAAGGELEYHDLMAKVFPAAEYPNAWRYPTKGGPRGCAMALGSAIRRYGFQTMYYGKRGWDRRISLPEKR